MALSPAHSRCAAKLSMTCTLASEVGGGGCVDRDEADRENLHKGSSVSSQGVWKFWKVVGAMEGFWFWRNPLGMIQIRGEGEQPSWGRGGTELHLEGRDLGGKMDRFLRGTRGSTSSEREGASGGFSSGQHPALVVVGGHHSLRLRKQKTW